jgi:hypothetical protein
MRKVCNYVRRPQSGKFPTVLEKNASAALFRTCAKLSSLDRKRFIYLLLQQIFLPAGTNCYLVWGEWDLSEIQPVYVSLIDISTDLAESWFEWAQALSKDGTSCRPQERVFWLIGELTKQISLEEVNRWLQGRPALLFSDEV